MSENLRKKLPVTINDIEFEVHEVSVGFILPILPRLSSTDHEVIQEAQLDLMKGCVYRNGQAIGEAVLELGLSTYMELIESVMDVNGLNNPDSEAGKD